MYGEARKRFQAALDEIRESGLWKVERAIDGPQGVEVTVGGRTVLARFSVRSGEQYQRAVESLVQEAHREAPLPEPAE